MSVTAKRNRGQIPLTAFLDILFASIGIFILFFVLQNLLTQKQHYSTTVDIYIACLSSGRFDLYIPSLRENKKRRNLYRLQVLEAIASFSADKMKAPLIAVGIPADGIASWNTLYNLGLKRLKSPSDQSQAISFRFFLYPLSDEPGAVDRFMGTTRPMEEEAPDGHG